MIDVRDDREIADMLKVGHSNLISMKECAGSPRHGPKNKVAHSNPDAEQIPT
jgi:hypothetical protein